MSNERKMHGRPAPPSMGGRGVGRWAAVAALIVGGIVLFFVYGGRTRPAVEPSIEEKAR